jgi:DNA polymerase-4
MSSAERWPRIILHADMDAFYASVEQHDRPELHGTPVIVGGTGRRGVVSAASYEARAFGVHSAMPAHEARRLCGHATFLPPRMDRYQEVSAQVMAVFDDYSPLVEPLSVDEAFLDMTGTEELFGPPLQTAQRLKVDVCEATDGLKVSVGVATTKFVAKVASDFDKPDGLTLVPPDGVHDFLWPLAIGRLWGVGPHTAERLESLGLRTIGDVAAADPALLTEHLGDLGGHLHRLSRGEDDREVENEREAKSVGAEYTLEQDIRGAAAVKKHLRRAADRVAPRLRRQGVLAGAVRVKIKTASFQLITRQAPLPRPMDDARPLFEAACELLGEFNLTVPMRLVGLAAFQLQPADVPVQSELFGTEGRQRNSRLERTLDELRGRFGSSAVKRGSDLD